MNARSVAKLRRTALAAALIAAFPALGQEEKPLESEVSLGLGWVSEDNTRFGQYSGMVKDRFYPLLDLQLLRRNEAAGIWTEITGRNLGLDSREARIEGTRFGDYRYFLEYSQTPRYSPYTPVTRLVGADSSSQTVNGVPTASPLDMSTMRKAIDLGLGKTVASRWEVTLRTRYEEKTGRRLYGRTGSDFLVDPIDYRTNLYEAIVGYAGEQAQFTTGYVGTNFVNNKTRLDVTGGTGTFTPLALPPGNESHQIYFGGGYSLTRTTRLTYKLAYTHQTQDEAFIDTPSNVAGRNSLGGVVDTTAGQIGITTRPTRDLQLLANFRKENRDDKTPLIDYFAAAGGENEPRSVHSTLGKLEATYALASDLKVTGGFDYDRRKRNTQQVHVVSFRETTEEKTWRLELRRTMSETLNGSVGVSSSHRTGSPWEATTVVSGALGSNLVHPLHLADRDSDKLRVTAGWMPLERIDLQAVAEVSRDEYGGRTLGLKDGTGQHYTLDAGWQASEAWKVNAWVSRDDTIANMTSCVGATTPNSGALSACPNTAASPIWTARLRNTGTALGAGVKGKVSGPLEVGAEFQHTTDKGQFRNSPAPTGLTSLPDVTYTRNTAKLTGKYAVRRNLGVRLQYVFDRFSTNDWTWGNWVYSDGTTVRSNSQQTVHFVGASVHYGF